jgi:uncharacterized membrane protein
MLFKKFLSYFLRGSLVFAPVAATIYIAWFVLKAVDQLLPIGVPGLGFLLTVILVTLVGVLASNVLGKHVIDEIEKLFTRVPLVKLLYTSIRDLINAFVGDKKRFDRPVAVALFPGGQAKALGFVTRESLTPLEGSGVPAAFHDHVAVYFPQSYNFAGNLLLVPKTLVQPVEAPSAEIMAFIVSGGVAGLGIGEHGLSVPPPPGPTTQRTPEKTQPIERG